MKNFKQETAGNYTRPRLEVIVVCAEQGFAASAFENGDLDINDSEDLGTWE